MGLLSKLLGRSGKPPAPARRADRPGPSLEVLESRDLLSVTAVVNNNVLAITAGPERDEVVVALDPSTNQLVVTNFQQQIATFDNASVNMIAIQAGDANNSIIIRDQVAQDALITVGNGKNVIQTGGGQTTVMTGDGGDKVVIGPGTATVDPGTGENFIQNVKPTDNILPQPGNHVSTAVTPTVAPPATVIQLDPAQVEALLNRAEASTSFDNAIIAVVDRSGRILGVRVENGVSTQLTDNATGLTFAVDGALAEARTAAFFASDAAPLTSRTIQAISQTTITQREVESNPSITDPNSTVAGPGYVAPIQIGGHFPPGVEFTPQVDLYDIQGTNRDTTINPVTGNVEQQRFNVPTADIPASILQAGDQLAPPDSYGFISGIEQNAQPRGIGTLPGGIPIYLPGSDGTPHLVGGIGVFFPGTTGYADEENSSMNANFDPTKPDLSQVAEYMAFAAVGGSPGGGAAIGNIAGIAPVVAPLPFGQINLVGITLPLEGGNGITGPSSLAAFGQTLGTSSPTGGVDLPVLPNANGTPGLTFPGAGTPFVVDTGAQTLREGTAVPDGWLVTPHDGVGVTAAQAVQIIDAGIAQAQITRAAIRLPVGSRTGMIFSVADQAGNIIALYRMPDATVFSIDVATAKSRNVEYYNNPDQLQPVDQVPGIPVGTAFTARTFRFLALPFFPEGINGQPPGPFSILNDPGTDPTTGLNTGAPVPASAFQSVQGFTDFHPSANFRDPFNPDNQNGVVFFPGSQGVYIGNTLIAGFGVSGDGVDQDDVVTMAGGVSFQPPDSIRVDNYFVNGVRLVYNKNNRNPEG
jgi:uncharacterized protein GlcG (DUF336 family)